MRENFSSRGNDLGPNTNGPNPVTLDDVVAGFEAHTAFVEGLKNPPPGVVREVADESTVDVWDEDAAEPGEAVPSGKPYRDGIVIGDLNGALAQQLGQMNMTVARGRNREDKFFKNTPTTALAWLLFLMDVKRGEKDGPCSLQGELVGDSGQRLAKNVVANHFVSIDSDTGADFDRIVARLRELGLVALVHTTHSHMRPTSEIPESKLISWRKAHASETTGDDLADCVAYLKGEKRVEAWAFEVECSVKREHAEGGVRYVVTHAPLPRLRVWLPLARAYSFSEGGTQAERIEAWKLAYERIADMLGAAWDRSCVDPSRLMYLPRIAVGADISQHKVVLLLPENGRLLDLDQLPGEDVASAFAGVGVGRDEKPRHQFKTPGMREFLRDHAEEFEALDFMVEKFGEDGIRRQHGDGACDFQCPNEGGHTNQDPHQTAFHVKNASANEPHGFAMWCLTDGCQTASGKDRAWYLDQACQQAGVKDARELRAWCSEEAQQAEIERQRRLKEDTNAKAVASEPDKLDEAIGALTPDSKQAAIDAVILQIAHLSSASARDGWIEKLAKRRGCKKSAVEADVNAHVVRLKRQARDDAKRQRQAEDVDYKPEKDDGCIWVDGDANVVVRKTLERLKSLNKTSPTLFRLADGTVVRLKRGEKSLSFEPMKRDQWSNHLIRHVEFWTNDPIGGDRRVAPPKYVIDYLMGDSLTEWPIIKGFSTVPIYGPDGKRRTAKGHDASTQLYIEPDADYTVQPHMTVDWAVWKLLGDAAVDFPFSDVFDGTEVAPIYSGERDEDGHLIPNWDRGASSRANFVAMLLQHFVRPMIDGECPAYVISKPKAGTGAGYLMHLLFQIVEGMGVAATPLDNSDSERRKLLHSLAIGGYPIAFLDNVNEHVDSGALAMTLTAERMRDRTLGVSKAEAPPIRGVFALTGNNLTMSHELMRRMVPIRLDASEPNPENRPADTFKHSPYKPWVNDNRHDLVMACYVLIENWLAAGRPAGRAHMASFESWAATLSGILEAAGVPGMLENRDAFMAVDDDEADEGADLIQRLFETFALRDFTPGEALDALRDKVLGAVEVVDLQGKTEDDRVKSLTVKLGRCKGNTFDVAAGGEPRRVKLVKGRTKTRRFWQLTTV